MNESATLILVIEIISPFHTITLQKSNDPLNLPCNLSNVLLISFYKEREDLVDLFIKIDKDKNGIKDSKHRVKTIYKKNLPTSPGLVQSLDTINRKYPISGGKKYAFKFLAIFGLLLGKGSKKIWMLVPTSLMLVPPSCVSPNVSHHT